MIEFVSFLIIIAALIGSIFYIILLRKRVLNLFTSNVQHKIDIHMLKKELEKAIKSTQESSIEQTDGFLKFVSESREWAFQYIEEVQASLEIFVKEVDSIIEAKEPPKQSLQKIIKAVEIVRHQLPKDDELKK